MKTGSNAVKLIKNAISLVVLIVVVILIAKGGVKAYSFGYAVFMDEAVADEGSARVVTITIVPGDSTLDVGRMLERRGLVESAYVFLAQSYCYESGRKLAPGSYDLTTDMNGKAIMNAIVTQSEQAEKAAKGE